MERRDFLRTLTIGTAVSAATGMLGSPGAGSAAEPPKAADQLPPPKETVRGDMRYRALGRTGEQVSALGLGGFHIGVPKDEQESIKIIRTAIDHGITFMDNCWDYHDGGSEIRMGKALRDGYRNKVFLMTKIDGRTREAAAKQIDESLKRLQTDRIDLLQHHEIIRLEDPDRIFAKGGAQEAVLDAQKAGKVRFIGFTGHKDPLVHLRMLEVAGRHQFHFDTVQMPLNVLDAHFRSFREYVLPVLVKEEIGVLGMKPMASGNVLKSQAATPEECLRFAMSLPTSTVISGMDSMEVLQKNLDVVKNFKPYTAKEMADLLERTAKAAAEGQFEPFKTTQDFDATAKHPEFLG
jgi:predicted aldo/keto reductase-like oxidoreductase